jgi:hypothetical protein
MLEVAVRDIVLFLCLYECFLIHFEAELVDDAKDGIVLSGISPNPILWSHEL